LHLDRRMVLGQGLLVGVEGDELHPLHPVGHHPVDGVAAAAAHAYHFDGSNVFVHLFIKHQSHNFVPPSGNMVTARPPGTGPCRPVDAQIILSSSYTSLSYHLLALIASYFSFSRCIFFNRWPPSAFLDRFVLPGGPAFAPKRGSPGRYTRTQRSGSPLRRPGPPPPGPPRPAGLRRPSVRRAAAWPRRPRSTVPARRASSAPPRPGRQSLRRSQSGPRTPGPRSPFGPGR